MNELINIISNINSLSIVPLFAGSIFLLIRLVAVFYPPKNINRLYGYRTTSSMKNADTWTTANNYYLQLNLKLGVCLLTFGLIALLLPDAGALGPVIGIIVMLGSMFFILYKTEKHLKKLFDKEGNRI